MPIKPIISTFHSMTRGKLGYQRCWSNLGGLLDSQAQVLEQGTDVISANLLPLAAT